MKVKMRWLPAFVSVFFAVGSLAAKKTSEQRFQEYHTKSVSSAPVKLVDATYRELTTAPRDYSVAVLLTALDARFGCQLCREFHPEWNLLSKSWIKGDKDAGSRTIFATLDFIDGKDVFMSVCVHLAGVLRKCCESANSSLTIIARPPNRPYPILLPAYRRTSRRRLARTSAI